MFLNVDSQPVLFQAGRFEISTSTLMTPYQLSWGATPIRVQNYVGVD